MRQKHLWNFLTLRYFSCVGPSLWGENFPSPCHFPLTPCLDHVTGQSTREGVQIYLAGSSMFNVGMKKKTILQTKSDSFGGSLQAYAFRTYRKSKLSLLKFLLFFFSQSIYKEITSIVGKPLNHIWIIQFPVVLSPIWTKLVPIIKLIFCLYK